MAACQQQEEVDLLIFNGNIQSLASGEWQPNQQAAAFKNGRVVRLGTDAEILEKYHAPSAKTIDLKGKFVYPGFIDAHAHFSWLLANFGKMSLSGQLELTDIAKKLAGFEAANPNMEALVGFGWQTAETADLKKLKKYLDETYPHKAVVLFRVDEHAAVANQKAFQLGDVDSMIEIAGGTIEQETGLLTDNALTPVRRALPEAPKATKKKWAQKAAQQCFENGLTAVSDSWLTREDIDFLTALTAPKDWQLIIFGKMVPSPENEAAYFNKGPQKLGSLYLNCLKIFADGALGSRGALLKSPYEDAPEHLGSALTDAIAFDSILNLADKYQLQVATHCIGDAAVTNTLDHYAAFAPKGKRWRIEHIQLIDNVDLERMAALGIIPSVQPVHATGDLPWLAERIGTARIKEKAYRNADLLEQCGLLAYGSDFPIEPLNPLEGFYSAVFRKPIPSKIGQNTLLFEDAYWQKQRIGAKEAILAMTYWAAVANFAEEELGSLESGKYGNFVVLNQDLTTPSKDFSAEVLATFIKAEAVYGGEDFRR